MFHEPWWLSAVTGGRHEEVIVERGGQTVGRLPYLATRRGPFRVSRMPPFTHLLGPIVTAGAGKPQTRMTRRLSITRALIDQLPPFLHFEQQLDPGVDDGLAVADGLAFQDRGFTVAARYTFEIDCRNSQEELWSAMHFKTRQHVRRAEEKYTVKTLDDPTFFVDNYLKHTTALGRTNVMPFEYFPDLFSACRSRQCCEIIAAFASDGAPISMAYVVWSDRTMYYLLSCRKPDPTDNGSASLLIWSAMKLAHRHGLTFDLDGIYTSGAARFLSGFGGQLKTRLIVRRSEAFFHAYKLLTLQSLKSGSGSEQFW
jgi:hypothetical protein